MKNLLLKGGGGPYSSTASRTSSCSQGGSAISIETTAATCYQRL